MLRNYFNTVLLFLSFLTIQNCYSGKFVYVFNGFKMPDYGEDSTTSLVIEKLAYMHYESKKINKEATILHAACLVGDLNWIKNLAALNHDNDNFKKIIKKRDSENETPKQLAVVNMKSDIATYFEELENK